MLPVFGERRVYSLPESTFVDYLRVPFACILLLTPTEMTEQHESPAAHATVFLPVEEQVTRLELRDNELCSIVEAGVLALNQVHSPQT